MARRGLLLVIGPGLMVAATGVGAGDLATAGFAGGQLGLAVLWAVVVGAFVKFVLTEGLTRWQLATSQTLLEGAFGHFGRWASVPFFIYLLPWSFFTAASLMSGCAVVSQTLFGLAAIDHIPIGFGLQISTKVVLGFAHTVLGVLMVWAGSFRNVERVMAACVGVMFAVVLLTAVLRRPDWMVVGRGLVWPTIPQWREGGLAWTIALIGGVGGTLTIICYGYWIREKDREDESAMGLCRIDLLVGYIVTALFGVAMIIISNGMQVDGKGAGLIVGLGERLQESIGNAGRLIFLMGAWAAVFSSLLGVWQAVPLVFADAWSMRTGTRSAPVDSKGVPYRVYLLAIAMIPLLQVSQPFREVQKYYAVLGAAFMPLLALVLLIMNNRVSWIGAKWRNHWSTNVILVVAIVLFVTAGGFQIAKIWL